MDSVRHGVLSPAALHLVLDIGGNRHLACSFRQVQGFVEAMWLSNIQARCVHCACEVCLTYKQSLKPRTGLFTEVMDRGVAPGWPYEWSGPAPREILPVPLTGSGPPAMGVDRKRNMSDPYSFVRKHAPSCSGSLSIPRLHRYDRCMTAVAFRE